MPFHNFLFLITASMTQLPLITWDKQKIKTSFVVASHLPTSQDNTKHTQKYGTLSWMVRKNNILRISFVRPGDLELTSKMVLWVTVRIIIYTKKLIQKTAKAFYSNCTFQIEFWDHTSIFRGRSIISTSDGRYTSIAWLSTVSLRTARINSQLCWTADVKMSRSVGGSDHDIRVDCRRQAVITACCRLTSTTPE